MSAAPRFARPTRRLSRVFQAMGRRAVRDPRYVFWGVFGLLVFVLTYTQALSAGLFDSVERPLFQSVNNLPAFLEPVMYGLTQFGGLAALLLWGGVAWYALNRRAMLLSVFSGWLGWTLAKVVKASVQRGRPGAFTDKINLFNGEVFNGYGFPSGHATLSAACAVVLYYQVPRRYRKYLLILTLLVGVSRMYLGAHFPLDIVGGWALGAVVGSTIALAFGTTKKRLSAQTLKKMLRARGYTMTTVRAADVDARGSVPLFMEDADGRTYFAKIFGKQEHAADWLFKTHRFFRYKNLSGEEPNLNSKRNIEMESFATMWAQQAGVRTARIVDMFRVGDSWLLLQERVEGIPLADHGNVRTATLEDAWHQVGLMHKARLAHRDLRAANLLVDTRGQVWVIDFGFAEVSARPERFSMDIAELLASMSLQVGAERTVAAAFAALDAGKIARALPYLQPAVFSGATLKALKAHKPLLAELRSSVHAALAIEEPVETANLQRISWKRTLNFGLIGVFLYVILPQAREFQGAFSALNSLNMQWVSLLAAGSLATYVLTGWVYVALANIPLRIMPTAIAQLAASYLSKVLPGGIGGAGLNVRYLTKAGMDPTDVSAVLAAQGIIGFVMFIVPLGLFLFMRGSTLGNLVHFSVPRSLVVGAAALMLALAAAIAFAPKLRRTLGAKVGDFWTGLREIATSPREIGLAAAASFGVTVAYVLCLFAAIKLVGVPLGLTAAVVVYATAIIAKSAIPTPGGLGPLEVAMVASMVSLGVEKGPALAAVVAYRLATYWLPIPFSLAAYKYLSHKRLI